MVVTDFGEKIAEGECRDVYLWRDMLVKILKPTIRKRVFGVPFDFPLAGYAWLRFGVDDFNREEFRNFRNLIDIIPAGLRDSFSVVYEAGMYKGRSYSLSEAILDADGGLSKSLRDHGSVSDGFFWGRLRQLEDVFVRDDVLLVDVRSHNFVVKDEGDRKLPVFIDYKRYGPKVYRFRPLLWSRKIMKNTIRKRFAKLVEKYSK